MVVSRVVARNAAGVHGDMRRGSVVVDGPTAASFSRAQKEIPAPSERESRGGVPVADGVEVRLELWLADHSSTVIGPVRVRGTR